MEQHLLEPSGLAQGRENEWPGVMGVLKRMAAVTLQKYMPQIARTCDFSRNAKKLDFHVKSPNCENTVQAKQNTSWPTGCQFAVFG